MSNLYNKSFIDNERYYLLLAQINMILTIIVFEIHYC